MSEKVNKLYTQVTHAKNSCKSWYHIIKLYRLYIYTKPLKMEFYKEKEDVTVWATPI